MKAVILSGGRGTRLSPLTDKKPKPLVCVGDRSLIEILIERLADYGISECAVTLGYRGEDIKNALGDACHGVKITYFEENDDRKASLADNYASIYNGKACLDVTASDYDIDIESYFGGAL